MRYILNAHFEFATAQLDSNRVTMLSVPEEITTPDTTSDLRQVGAHPNHWYPVAWSREIKSGKTFATSFGGEPIVLIRPQEGPAFALEDRCAHRQVPLSKGVVYGCTVRCCYHGWSYDASGRCVDVPYLGKAKLPNGVRPYPCHERDGMIFVWPGSGLATASPDTLGAANDRSYKTRRFGKIVRCHYTFMHENLMVYEPSIPASEDDGQGGTALSWMPRWPRLDRARLQFQPPQSKTGDWRSGDRREPSWTICKLAQPDDHSHGISISNLAAVGVG
jgi:nitrite reductase/ring-hydroxylating ferredoxin subunit